MFDHKFADPNAAVNYILAGNAIVTLRSEKTNVHFTYKIQAKRNDVGKRDAQNASLFFVSYLNGPNNETNYQYLGILKKKDGQFEFALTKNSHATAESSCSKAFQFLTKQVIQNNNIPKDLSVYHTGFCGRCGRLLTEPESIESGIGPVCATKRR